MDESGCRYCHLMVFAGTLLLFLALQPQAGCGSGSWRIHMMGCFLAGLGLLGEIRSLVRFRLGPLGSLSNRHWLRTWPIIFRSWMFLGVLILYFTVQASLLPSFHLRLDPDFSGLLSWYRIHLVGWFCLVAGLLTSAITLTIRSWLQKNPHPLGFRPKLLGALLLLGVILLAGRFVFSQKAPDFLSCQADLECNALGTLGSESIDDRRVPECLSYRYYAFWPSFLWGGSYFFCGDAFEYHPQCYCEDNRCMVNWGEFYR